MTAQPGLFDPPPPDLDALEWVSGEGWGLCPDCPPERHYPVIVRAPEDPERKPRPKGGQADRTPHLTLRKTSREDWHEPILGLLADGKPRTLNAIGVELIDKTADITAWTPFGYAVFDLVVDHRVQMTTAVPLRFRLAR